MSTRKQKNESSRETIKPVRRRTPLALPILLAASVVAVVFFFWLGKEITNSPTAANKTVLAGPDLQKLKGQWLRPDGGYIIEIQSIEAGGKVQAGYYNPKPIRVSRATAGQEGEAATLFIELNDVGYPGSTYTLNYDSANDRLLGIYYQAAMHQSFEVVFVRMN
jgi:hypothetical protein